MKLTRRILLRMMLIFILTLVIFTSSSQADNIISDNKYLKQNYSSISNDNEDASLELHILDDDIKENEIFLTGEAHGNSANHKLQMKFLKYFKQKTNLKYLLAEISYSEACYINQYLESGKIEIAKTYIKKLQLLIILRNLKS
jgi:hypothetical protein